MIRCIKLKDYKGIKEVKLSTLAHINVFCGKNNSGKSSLIEAIRLKEKSFLGRTLTKETVDVLLNRFGTLARTFSNPPPDLSLKWFKRILEEKINTTLYQDEIENLNRQLGEEFHKDTRFATGTFDFRSLFYEFISFNETPFDPILISPKRQLSTKASLINLRDDDPPEKSILHRLFLIGSQNDKAKEWTVHQRIRSAFEEITDGCQFHIQISNKYEEEIFFLNSIGDWIGADDSGLGMRDILVILHYVLDSPHTAILIEEPENHIHPDMQRRLLKFISSRNDKQFFLTTHSNIFLDPSYVERVFYIQIRNGQVEALDETNKANMLANLGYSIVDNLISDLVVLTEGPTDISVLRAICDKLGLLQKYNIKFNPLGGDIMHFVDLSIFTEKCKVMAIVDILLKLSRRILMS